MLSYWLVQTLGEGQPQTILSPAVGKSRERDKERGLEGGEEREREGQIDVCFNIDVLA